MLEGLPPASLVKLHAESLELFLLHEFSLGEYVLSLQYCVRTRRSSIYVDSSVPACSATHVCGVPVGPILVVFDLARRHQYGSAFVLNQEHYEFRRFGLAGVSPDDVNIRGTFIEGLTRCQSHFLSAPHLHHD